MTTLNIMESTITPWKKVTVVLPLKEDAFVFRKARLLHIWADDKRTWILERLYWFREYLWEKNADPHHNVFISGISALTSFNPRPCESLIVIIVFRSQEGRKSGKCNPNRAHLKRRLLSVSCPEKSVCAMRLRRTSFPLSRSGHGATELLPITCRQL